MKTYIGCYLKLYNKNIPQTKKVYYDNNGDVTSYIYDPTTGEENTLKTEVVNEVISPSPFIDEYFELSDEEYDSIYEWYDYEEFFCPESHENYVVFLCNRKNEFTSLDDGVNYSFNVIDLSNLDVDKLIIMFKRKYKREIELYKKYYGRVEVSFGCVNYYS